MKSWMARAALLVGIAVVLLLTALRWYDPPIIQNLRDYAFDQSQRISPREYVPVPVRIVDIDERSLSEVGQWPWSRTLQAKLLNRLRELGAAVVSFDVLFSEPDRMSPKNVIAELPGIDAGELSNLPDNDQVFAEQIAAQPTVLGFAAIKDAGTYPEVKAGFAFTGENPINAPPYLSGATVPLPMLQQAAAGLGDISMNPGTDATVVRAMPLFLTDGKQFYPSLVMESLRVAQGASTYIITNAPEVEGSISQVKVGEFVAPTTAAGEIRLYMGPERADRYVSASDVMNPEKAAEIAPMIEGNIVLVGTSAAGLLDIRGTTLGQNVPGVSLHAQAIEQIITQKFLERPDWADGLEVLTVLLVGLLVVFTTAYVSPIVAISIGTIASLIVLLGSWYFFRHGGLLLDPTFPVATALISQFAVLGFRFLTTDKDRRQIRRAFGQYVSPAILARVEAQPESLKLGGVDREITLLFMDVRSFTSISERMTPTALVGFLNKLLSGLSIHVIKTEGTLDKFIGDSIMAFWNAPVDVADHTRKGALCALGMREAMREMNATDAFGLGFPIGIGVGLNVGVACVGNMGSESRFNYSAVGDAVNVTARIESACKEVGFDLLLSKAAAERLPDFAILATGSFELKGKSESQQLFLLVGDESVAQSPAFQEIAKLHDSLNAASSSAEKETLLGKLAALTEQFSPPLNQYYTKLARKVPVAA